MFDFSYKKNSNDSLFRDFEKEDLTNIYNIQNYIPLYNTFFSLNEKNWNSINLNNQKHIQSIYSKTSNNIYNIQINNNKITTSFFKFSPLIDPVKYMYGKYSHYSDSQLYSIPTFKNVQENDVDEIHDRMLRKNNVSYVDGFFSYLSSKLKQEHGIINCQEYYGSFLGLKRDFKIDIFEDIEYFSDSDFFYDNNDKLFTIDEEYKELFDVNHSRKNKQPLDIIEDSKIECCYEDITELDNSINEIFQTTKPNTNNNIIQLEDVNINDADIIYEFNLPNEKQEKLILDKNASNDENEHSEYGDDSCCSSRSSKTSHNEDKNTECSGTNSDSHSDSDTYSTLSDEQLIATIHKIPVQIICLENLKETLDDYMNKCDVEDNEWVSILLQIIFTLIIYQKAYEFTHNDLHTNNIMYSETEEEYVYYKYNKEYYRVPTYGKIWKIIDFGRAIYTFKGKRIISDSYHKNEDAGTQFNFAEYYDKSKPIVEPNYAFDLCRLSCSLFDYFFDSIKDVKDCKDRLSILIDEWCRDDNNRNVLYKDNNKERYPGFKLYKMITRTVSKHTPVNQLKNPLFSKMKVKRRHLKKSSVVVDIDKIPCYA